MTSILSFNVWFCSLCQKDDFKVTFNDVRILNWCQMSLNIVAYYVFL